MRFSEFKKAYWQIKLSDQEVNEGWKDLQLRIKPPVSSWLFRPRVIVAGLILVLGLSTGVISASPASPLYSTRVFTDKVVSDAIKKPEINIERRAEDVVKSVDKPAQLDKASEEYEKALEAVKPEVKIKEKEKTNQGLQKGLEKAEEKFDQTIKKDPKSKNKIAPILEKTKEVKKELRKKGETKYF